MRPSCVGIVFILTRHFIVLIACYVLKHCKYFLFKNTASVCVSMHDLNSCIIRIANRHRCNGCIGERIVSVYHNILYYYIMHIRTNYSSNATLTILNKCRLPYEIHNIFIYIFCTGEVRFYNFDAAVYYIHNIFSIN